MRTFPTAPSVSDLDRSCITVTSVDRDWQQVDEHTGDYRDPYPTWEPVRYQLDRGDQWIEVPAVAHYRDVVALILGENKHFLIEDADYPAYIDALCDSYGVDSTADLPDDAVTVLTEDEYDDLCRDPEVDSAEGPMMNYSYDLRTTVYSDSYGYKRGRDPIEVAAKMLGLPMCVVDIDDDLHLALTGGGMDLSWEINEAYVRLGHLPPVAFDLPGMAGRGESEADQLIINAALTARRELAERSARDVDYFADRWAKYFPAPATVAVQVMDGDNVVGTVEVTDTGDVKDRAEELADNGGIRFAEAVSQGLTFRVDGRTFDRAAIDEWLA